jgi:hypothetical protein
MNPALKIGQDMPRPSDEGNVCRNCSTWNNLGRRDRQFGGRRAVWATSWVLFGMPEFQNCSTWNNFGRRQGGLPESGSEFSDAERWVVGLKLFHVEQFEMGRRGNRTASWVEGGIRFGRSLGRIVPRGTILRGGRVEIVPRGTILAVGWIFDWINKRRVGRFC